MYFELMSKWVERSRERKRLNVWTIVTVKVKGMYKSHDNDGEQQSKSETEILW
jgi:hypothetical protein